MRYEHAAAGRDQVIAEALSKIAPGGVARGRAHSWLGIANIAVSLCCLRGASSGSGKRDRPRC